MYLQGAAAIRTGLNAFGAGRYAPFVQPILIQLRQATQHTAFLAFVAEMELLVGPHSIGRETRATRLCRRYSFETIPEIRTGEVCEIALRHVDGEILRRLNVLMVPVQRDGRGCIALCLVLNSGRAVAPILGQALQHAYGQTEGALGDA